MATVSSQKINESGMIELSALLSYYFKVLVRFSCFELSVKGMYPEVFVGYESVIWKTLQVLK